MYLNPKLYIVATKKVMMIGWRSHFFYQAYRRGMASLCLSLPIPLVIMGSAHASIPDRIQSMFDGDPLNPAIGRLDGRAVSIRACNFFEQLRPDSSRQDSVTALMPQTNQGTTVLPYPTFWFYVPTSHTLESEVEYLEFDVDDETGRSLLEDGPIQVPLPDEPGFVGVKLPETSEPLQPGHRYNWSLTLECGTDAAVNNPFVYGWVERITAADDLVSELAATPADSRFIAYAQNDVWYETVTHLAKHHNFHRQVWTELLALFELDGVAQDVAVQEFLFEVPDDAVVLPMANPSELLIGRANGGPVQGGACSFYNRTRVKVPSEEHFIALIPDTHHGATVLPYPTFWFYLPLDKANDSEVQALELTLENEAGESVIGDSPLRSPLPDQPGIIGLKLPNSVEPLQVGDRYQWTLTIRCDDADASANPFVYGWIERMASGDELSYRLQSSAPDTKYRAYAEYNVWYEMISQLARTHADNPQAWADVLEPFGLADMAPEGAVQSLFLETSSDIPSIP